MQEMEENWVYSTLIEILPTDEIERIDEQSHLRIYRKRFYINKTLKFISKSKDLFFLVEELSLCRFIKM